MGSLGSSHFPLDWPHTHEGELVAPSSWARLVTGGGEKEMNGLDIRGGGANSKKGRASICIS